MTINLIKLGILLIVFIFVLIPFFRKEEESEDYEKSRVFDLLSQKDIVFGTLLDLEYDYKMGKLSKEDYKSLKIQMKNEAAHLLKEIDNTEKNDSTK